MPSKPGSPPWAMAKQGREDKEEKKDVPGRVLSWGMARSRRWRQGREGMQNEGRIESG